MEYHEVGKTGWKVSALSFGCMRFQDADSAGEAVRKAIELGVNYFDVAPAYCKGHSESWLGSAIRGLRDKLFITAKSSPGNGGAQLGEYDPENGFGIRTADQARRQIERSMKLLGVDHLDMYQFWANHSEDVFADGIKPGGFLEGVLKAKEEGLFDFIGMTTHSRSAEIIHFIQDSPYEFDMVTIPFNIACAPERAEAVEYCRQRGIGVIAMNPLAGGRLTKAAPVQQRLAKEFGFTSLVEPSLRFAAFYPGMTGALNGITFAAQADQGAKAIANGPLPTDVQQALPKRLAEIYENVNLYRICTSCGYCEPCPRSIRIPKVLDLYVSLRVSTMREQAAEEIRQHSGETGWNPSACDQCGRCEEKCPNNIPVRDMMAEAVKIWPK